jgi:hypothetical protein
MTLWGKVSAYKGLADLKFGDGISLWVFIGRYACVLDWRNAILNDYVCWESDGFDFGLYWHGVLLLD